MNEKWERLRLEIASLLIKERVSRSTDQCHPVNLKALESILLRQKVIVEELSRISTVRQNVAFDMCGS